MKSAFFPESPAGEGFPFSCPGGLGVRGRGRPWGNAGACAPMQRADHFFEKKTFPCSVPLKVLGVTSAPASPDLCFPIYFQEIAFPCSVGR